MIWKNMGDYPTSSLIVTLPNCEGKAILLAGSLFISKMHLFYYFISKAIRLTFFQ